MMRSMDEIFELGGNHYVEKAEDGSVTIHRYTPMDPSHAEITLTPDQLHALTMFLQWGTTGAR